MIYSADVVLPITSAPIRAGAVLVREGRVAAVGALADLVAAYPGEEARGFEGAILMPGLVNLHGHLECASFGALAGPTPFPQWLERIIKASRGMERDDWAAASKRGIELYLEAGITCTADITRSGAGLQALAQSGMPAVVYIEAVGIDAGNLASAMVDLLEKIKAAEQVAGLGNLKIGLSPHSPYTLSAGALVACAEISESQDLPLSIHLAETRDEVEMIQSGAGPLAEKMGERLSLEVLKMGGFKRTPAEFLDGVHLINSALIAAHGVWLTDGDIELMKARSAAVAVCPTSNELLGVGEAPIAKFIERGLRFGIGTDSLASNPHLDLFEEVRKVRRLLARQAGAGAADGLLSTRALIRMVTRDAAEMLGFSDELGSIEDGKRADFIVVDCPVDAVSDPYGYLVGHASRAAIRHTLLAGDIRYTRR